MVFKLTVWKLDNWNLNVWKFENVMWHSYMWHDTGNTGNALILSKLSCLLSCWWTNLWLQGDSLPMQALVAELEERREGSATCLRSEWQNTRREGAQPAGEYKSNWPLLVSLSSHHITFPRSIRSGIGRGVWQITNQGYIKINHQEALRSWQSTFWQPAGGRASW